MQRIFLTVDGLAARTGGAVRLCEQLMAVPGVVNVGIDPWVGLVGVDHDPTICISEALMAAIEEAR